MEFNIFIIPVTLIIVQLLKRIEKLDNNYLPFIAVSLGLVMGLLYGLYYNQDLFVHAFYGLVYGASASGIYDVGKSGKEVL
jgi:hypothetical protein